jgi:uncharacterized protein (TIGR02145 family)
MWNPYCNNHYAKFERVTVYYPKSCCNVKPTPPISTTTTTSSSTTTSTSTTSTSTSTSSTTTTTSTTANPCLGLSCIENDIIIGTQTWTGCNLNVDRYRNGDLIPEVTDPIAWAALTTGAWCWYNNDSANGPVYGKLYNWYAVSDPRGLAPLGYHIATGTEWSTLRTYLGGNTLAGGPLKETGFCHWLAPNTGATNSSGFTAVGGGVRSSSGTFVNIKFSGKYWTSTVNDSTSAILYEIFSNITFVGTGASIKNDALSVRCIKD